MSQSSNPPLKLPGLQTPKAIFRSTTAGGLGVPPSMTLIPSGALTAATLATVLNLTGSGVLSFLALQPVDATARNTRLQLIMDGVTVFDDTLAASSAGMWNIAVGYVNNSGNVSLGSMPYKSSCVVKISSNLTETNKLNLVTRYRTN